MAAIAFFLTSALCNGQATGVFAGQGAGKDCLMLCDIGTTSGTVTITVGHGAVANERLVLIQPPPVGDRPEGTWRYDFDISLSASDRHCGPGRGLSTSYVDRKGGGVSIELTWAPKPGEVITVTYSFRFSSTRA